MAFGHIRIRNLSPSSIGATERHNERKYKEGLEPKNIRPEATKWNSSDYYIPGEHNPVEAPREMTLKDVINHRLDAHSIQLKSNQNCAIEFVVGASKDFWERYHPRGHFSNAHTWLEEKYGRGSVVAKSEHFDESNPHCHFIVVPIQEKEIKWKNRNGQGSRIESRLAIREITGGREKLRTMQDDYFKFIKPYGDAHGIEFKRGERKAKGELEKYVQHTNHEIGEIGEKIKAIRSDLRPEKERLERIIAYDNKMAEIEAKTANLEREAAREDKAKKINFDRGVGSELDRPARKAQVKEDDDEEPTRKKSRGMRH